MSRNLNLDHDEARALHRIVRAMHDGECPKCHTVHEGTIYKALASAGWQEDGYTKPERTYVRNGRMVNRKRGPRTLTHAEMLAGGCECVGTFRRKRFVHRIR